MRTIYAIATAVGLLVLGSGLSFAAEGTTPPAPECTTVTAQPMDAGFKLVAIARPAIEAKVKDMIVQVVQPADQARLDSVGPDANITGVKTCDKGVRYQVKVVRIKSDADGKVYDVAQVPLPSTAKDVVIQSGSATAKKNWSGNFNGDFTKVVILAESATDAPATTLPSGFKW